MNPQTTLQLVSPQRIIMPIIERITEGAAFYWLWRSHLVNAANVRLMNLSQCDEKLAAHVEAIGRGGSLGLSEVTHQMTPSYPGTVFAALAVALALAEADWLQQVFERVGPLGSGHDETEVADPFALIGVSVSAIAWTERDAASTAIDRLRTSQHPCLRAIALGAGGARRSDLGPALTSAVSDCFPIARARACRAAGQLGRHDLMAHLRAGVTDRDPECRFWSAWAASRMGAGEEALGVLAEIAWTNQPRAVRALDLLLRRLEVPRANAWLREFAKLPDRHRDLIRATGVVGDPVYIPWLIERMAVPETARLAGEAFSMITGLDLAYRDLDRKPPRDFESGPNDDPADENVALDEDENLPWPDPSKIGDWWLANLGRFTQGTGYFLGRPKSSADWLEALSDAYQRQRHAAALELAIRTPRAAMFEVRARGRLQRQLIARARGLA